MNLQEIKSLLSEFKGVSKKGAITPESLGTLLENMVTALGHGGTWGQVPVPPADERINCTNLIK